MLYIMVELPEEILNHIKSFIPRDKDMRSPVADLLKVDKYVGRYTAGPSKYKFFFTIDLITADATYQVSESVVIH